MYSLWSHVFVANTLEETGCYTTMAEWTKIHAELPDAKRIFARCKVGDKEAFCALGEPVNGIDEFSSEHPSLVIPRWFQTILAIDAAGEAHTVEWITEEFFPQATKILLRPHDSAFYHSDAKGELEVALTRYGVLQKGATIPIPLVELGGYTVLFDIVDVEPANIVLLEGEEVAIEFEEALDAIPPPIRIPSPAPSDECPSPPQIVRRSTPFPDDILTLHEPPTITGEILGGVTHAPLPDGRPWNPWR